MADSKDYKYLNRKILSQESSNIYYLEVMTNVNFKKKGQMSRSKGLIPTERSYQ